MQVLVIGGGGREHALAWKIAASRLVGQVFVAPGNAGTAGQPGVTNVALAADDIDGLLAFALDHQIGLTVVGPEAPLVAGVVDRFRETGLPCFGPVAEAAKLEGSKHFAKAFMGRHDIPTASYQAFTDVAEALEYLGNQSMPIVVKADGLAAGKGVIVAETREVAAAAVQDMLSGNAFGDAGGRVVIEDFLEGEEASFICMVDGKNVLPMASSQDHKAAHDGDTGPNTGGMGAYSPSPLVDDAMCGRIMNQVIQPLVRGMAEEGNPYTGFLYAGLMIGNDGVPNVVEFNCRFGDPEAQPVLSRLQSDLASHCLAATRGQLDQETARWDPRAALGVVMAAKGYPGAAPKGDVIFGLDETDKHSDNPQGETLVFHAGTALDGDQVVTSGGRVLCVTALGRNVVTAQELAYARARSIHWEGSWYRTDIGHRAIRRERDAAG